jgi:hypothetical protein
VPGVGFEPTRPFGQGGLRPPVGVSLVPFSPSSMLWSAASVRAVSLVSCGIAECAPVLCTFCAPPRWRLSYHLYYLRMAVRQKRSISLSPDLAETIDLAAHPARRRKEQRRTCDFAVRRRRHRQDPRLTRTHKTRPTRPNASRRLRLRKWPRRARPILTTTRSSDRSRTHRSPPRLRHQHST